jgi:deoxycytidylate deaminase
METPLSLIFVDPKNKFLQIAKEAAETLSQDQGHKTGAVIVQNEEIIAFGWNGSPWHEIKGFCERKKQGVATGTMYHLCGGCHPHFHAERRALRVAQNNGISLKGATMYLWGHWWCCEECTKHLQHAQIQTVCLAEGARELFGKK